jgi:hypothetical protein
MVANASVAHQHRRSGTHHCLLAPGLFGRDLVEIVPIPVDLGQFRLRQPARDCVQSSPRPFDLGVTNPSSSAMLT